MNSFHIFSTDFQKYTAPDQRSRKPYISPYISTPTVSIISFEAECRVLFTFFMFFFSEKMRALCPLRDLQTSMPKNWRALLLCGTCRKDCQKIGGRSVLCGACRKGCQKIGERSVLCRTWRELGEKLASAPSSLELVKKLAEKLASAPSFARLAERLQKK